MFPCIVNIEFISANGHSNIIHGFSSPAHLLWRHPLPKHPTSLFTSAELVPRLLEVWGKTAHALFAAHNISSSLLSIKGQYSLHVFDIQHAEQDDGALQCNRGATRKCCNNCFDMYKCELLI